MKISNSLLVIFCLPILALSILASPASSQKVTICVDFSVTDHITESQGEDVNVTPSGFSATEKAAIIAQVQSIFEATLGKGNVVIKDAALGPCGENSKTVIVNGDTGTGKEYGDAQRNDGVAVVHEGIFRKQGFKGDTLKAGVAESIAHEGAHLFGIDHNDKDTLKSIMVEGGMISLPVRMKDHRVFTPFDSLRFVKHLLASNTAPATGSLGIDYGLGKPKNTPDEFSVDLKFTPRYDLETKIGYTTFSGEFKPAIDLTTPTTPSLTFLGTTPFNIGVQYNGTTYDLYSSQYYLAAPNPANPNVFTQGMFVFDFNNDHVADQTYFANYASSSPSGGLKVEWGNVEWNKSPIGGRVIGSDYLSDFKVTLRPKRLTVDDGYLPSADVYWYPPLGREIVDGRLYYEYRDTLQDKDVAKYDVLLDDGSVRYLKFVTTGHKPNIVTTITETGGTSPGIGLGYATYDKLFGSPFTTYGGYATYRYVPATNSWLADSTGLFGAQINSVADDKKGMLYAATSKGLYSQPYSALSWTRNPINFLSTPITVYSDRKLRLYLATYTTVYVSVDNGASFTPMNTGLPSGMNVVSFGDDAFGNVYAIASTYLAPSQLYKSAGGVAPWVRVGLNITADIHDRNGGFNFTSIKGDSTVTLATLFGFYTSTDQGGTWVADNQEVSSSGYYSMVKTPTNQTFIGTDNGFFSGHFGDPNWTKSFPQSGYLTANQRPIYQDGAGVLYTLGTKLSGLSNLGYSIAKSFDGGMTWSEDSLSTALITANGKYFVDVNGKEYFATNGSNGPTKIYSHPKLATSWALDQVGFVPNVSFEIVNAFGSDGSTTYLATGVGANGTFWKNLAGTWATDTLGLNGTQIYSIAADGKGTLYGGTAYGILMHSNNRWSNVPLPSSLPGGATAFYVATDKSGALFGAFVSQGANFNYDGRGVYFTTDKGANWTRCDLGDYIQLNGLYSFGDTTYALTNQGIFPFTSKLWSTSYTPEGEHHGQSTTIHLGTVPMTSAPNVAFSLTNFGNAALTVSKVAVSDANLKLTSGTPPYTVAPAGAFGISGSFTPSKLGTYLGSFVVQSSSQTGSDTVFVDATVANAAVTNDLHGMSYRLEQNYPNPLNPSTSIGYSIGMREHVTLRLIDVLGREQAILVDQTEEAGRHVANLNAENLPAGIYTYTLSAGQFSASRSMVIMH